MDVKYSYDSLGAPIEIIDDEPAKVGITWNGQDIREDEQVLSHKAFISGGIEWITQYLFEDDIYEYIKSLEREDLIEILEKIDVQDIKDAADMEEVYL